MKTIVLGGGLAGIALGRRLKEKGEDFLILEKNSRVGGLCRSFRSGDWLWDLGVHAIYSKSREAMQHFRSLPLAYRSIERNARVFYHNNGAARILDYPFENGIRDLPLKEKIQCIAGYIKAQLRHKKEAGNLEEWIGSRLGYGIARYFMNPYNNKVWNARLEDISMDLVKSRIGPIPFNEFILSILKRTHGRLYQAGFIYPVGGMQALVDTIARGLEDRIRLDAEVIRIEEEKGAWSVIYGDDRSERAERIVSTIPLVDLLNMVDIKGLDKDYGALRYNDTYFVMIGLQSLPGIRMLQRCHWAFFPGEEIFYRITFMHNFTPESSPALVAEITNKGEVKDKSEEEIKKRVVEDLTRLRIIESSDDIGTIKIHLERCTYPIPMIGLNEARNAIRQRLEEKNIYLLGRSGNWEYINMDEVISRVWEFRVT